MDILTFNLCIRTALAWIKAGLLQTVIQGTKVRSFTHSSDYERSLKLEELSAFLKVNCF